MSTDVGAQKKAAKNTGVIKLNSRKIKQVKPAIDPDRIVFALDIGTRTVIGIVGYMDEKAFTVLAAETLEHKSRAMLDGQIHDINSVAAVVRELKAILEAKTGLVLQKVAIAAAGRVLKTCQVKAEREIEQGREIDQQLVSGLEMEAIQQAQLKLDEQASKDDKNQFYCVGYSVINYCLNNYVITSLIGHKGSRIGAEVLATFLPHIVVDSLYTVMDRVGLEVVSLTLEPIAAINATIPEELRLLNIALVDIGAGTSDIAITKNGSVIAYAMASVAGDEITEKIAQHYLVDFNTAERIKINTSAHKGKLEFVDILGKKNNTDADEVERVIKPAVESLADIICSKIMEYNGKQPNAVFLIGGGSRASGLCGLIAGRLGLPEERVAVRGRDVIQNIKYSGKKLTGPEAITPFGIALTACIQRGQDFLSVTVNGKKIRLFNSKKLTVADALILIGFNPRDLIGRTGKSLSFTLNDRPKTIKGEHGSAASILVNGTQANLGTVLNVGDIIQVEGAKDGEDAKITVDDIVPSAGKFTVHINGTAFEAGTSVGINGKTAEGSCSIREGDVLSITSTNTLGQLLKSCNMDLDAGIAEINGSKAVSDSVLSDGDIIEYTSNKDLKSKTDTVISSDNEEQSYSTNGTAASSNDTGNVNSSNGLVLYVTINNKSVELTGKTQYIFVDMFNYINIDLSKPQGTIVLKLNGRQAAFTDSIKSGDIIDIYWDKVI